VTGQVQFDSYENAGVVAAAELVNALAVTHEFGRPVGLDDPTTAVRQIIDVDPTWPSVGEEDIPGFTRLAATLRRVFDDVDAGDLDAAANRLNDLLAEHPAHPHLAKDGGRWHLHHHPADAALVPMATAICADALARVIGADAANRLGSCNAPDCDRVFVDGSKNASRRFCSTTCQNRVKAAAFRRRHAASNDK
jgi:predicted RNA-binding Zn ribbon-like protein